MLHSILKISGAQVMNKSKQSAIQGGFNSSCQQTCRIAEKMVIRTVLKV